MTCVKYFYRITFVIDNRNYILTYTNMYEINVYAIKKKKKKMDQTLRRPSNYPQRAVILQNI